MSLVSLSRRERANDEASDLSRLTPLLSLCLCSLADNRRLPYNHRQRSFANGTVMIDLVDKRSDAGEYKCVVKSAHKVASKTTRVIVESKSHIHIHACETSTHKLTLISFVCVFVQIKVLL